MSLPEVGQPLHARYSDDGNFYAATVIAVSKRRGKKPVKVEFKGWEGDAEWFSLDDLKCKALGLSGKSGAEAPAPNKSAKAAKAPAPAPTADTKKGRSKKIAVTPADVPSIGEQVNTKGPKGKLVSARVVAASLQVQYADGSTAWVDSADIAPQFKCTACSQTFTTELGRDNHWWDRHIVTCSTCGKVFDNETKRDEHWWDTHIEYCKQCGKICEDIGALVEHVKEVHAINCKQCGKQCSSIRSLVQHARDVHQYSQNLIEVPRKEEPAASATKKKQTSAGKSKKK